MEKKFNIVYADPPWRYERAKGEGVAEAHYHTMSIEELREIPVEKIVAKDAVLLLWATFPMLSEALSLFQSWGFKYKTCAFNWIKQNPKADSFFVGLGFWTRSCSEICLLGTRGHPRRVSAKVSQLVIAHRLQHSKKPDEVREAISRICGDLPKIELFARQEFPGWDCWGNQTGEFGGKEDANGRDLETY